MVRVVGGGFPATFRSTGAGLVCKKSWICAGCGFAREDNEEREEQICLVDCDESTFNFCLPYEIFSINTF